MKIVFLLVAASLQFCPQQADAPGDYALAVRDTRLFAGLEPYADILGLAEAGSFSPLAPRPRDRYGIRWAEVRLPDGGSAFLSDVIVMREREAVLRRLLQMADIGEIGLWDDEALAGVQERGVEIGFTVTQLLFAQGPPLREREIFGLREWSYRRLVVLVGDDAVVGFTKLYRLPRDRSILIELTSGDPEFTAASGAWEEVAAADRTFMLASGENARGRFRFRVPLAGTYRLSARWGADDDLSARTRYRLRQGGHGGQGGQGGHGGHGGQGGQGGQGGREQGGEEIAVLRANQKLHGQSWVWLGDIEASAGSPLVIDISAEDGLPFRVEALRIEYLNEPLDPAQAHER